MPAAESLLACEVGAAGLVCAAADGAVGLVCAAVGAEIGAGGGGVIAMAVWAIAGI